ncbi:GxxExxY protein [Dyadobacter psychrotolerans]|uniref:GxxExxY protein n=1 Tax=Dyadobacter psychrotolerans TaxID=2541721 RepID=A0A4R5DL89_9BACT|nr:GxxExxY protein [Dyadobacter psychrotolerans]TDE11625.1 GxxExxY protein [Dyadobacter psychrotolerans]
MDLIYKEESYEIIGKCMEVHNELGHGFLEIVYKDALEILFNRDDILYEREKVYPIYFQEILLPHQFYADFVIFNKIILEVKCCNILTDEHLAQTINYLKASRNRLGLLVNFGRGKLEYKRLVL